MILSFQNENDLDFSFFKFLPFCDPVCPAHCTKSVSSCGSDPSSLWMKRRGTTICSARPWPLWTCTSPCLQWAPWSTRLTPVMPSPGWMLLPALKISLSQSSLSGSWSMCRLSGDWSMCRLSGNWSVCRLSRDWSVCRLSRDWSMCRLSRDWSVCRLSGNWSVCRLSRDWSMCRLSGNWSVCRLSRDWSVCRLWGLVCV